MSFAGEYVAFEFKSSDATTAAAITLKNSDSTVFTLRATDRLIIDQVFGYVASAVTSIELFDDKDGDGTVDAGELIFPAGTGNVGGWIGGSEGFSVSVGSVPKVKAAVAGAISLAGIARIQRGKENGNLPEPYQASLIPGV